MTLRKISKEVEGMTFRFFDRFFAAIAGLILLFLGVCALILGLGIFPFSLDHTVQSFLRGDFQLWQRILMVVISLVACALGVHNVSFLLRRRKDQGFIMQHTEYGDMSISMYAMEAMVKKCVDTHEELKVTHTKIRRSREGVVVDIRISLGSGVNIPLTVNALQKQIKHYITSCSGVDVKEVRVMVEMGGHSSKSTEVMTPEMAAAEACVNMPASTDMNQPAGAEGGGDADGEKEPIHQRLFKHDEMPSVFPEPPLEILDKDPVFVEAVISDDAEIHKAEVIGLRPAEGLSDTNRPEQDEALDDGVKEND